MYGVVGQSLSAGSRCAWRCARAWKMTFGAGPGSSMEVGEASTYEVRTPSCHASIGTWKPSVWMLPQAYSFLLPPSFATAAAAELRSCA